MKTINIISTTIIATFLIGCGDPKKDQFVRGCGQGQKVLEDKCECVYEYLEDELGDPEKWIARLYSNDPEFYFVLEKAGSKCR